MTQRRRGVFLDLASLGDDINTQQLAQCDVEWAFYPETAPDQVDQRIADADIVITNKVVLTAEMISSAPSLQLICVAATGTNNVDLAAASTRKIPVCNVTNYGTASVAQHTFSLLLALTTQLAHYSRDAINGRWSESAMFCLMDYPVYELQGKTMGILGHGTLGQAVANIATAFGMKVIISERPGVAPVREGRVAFGDLLPQVDVLSLHCPLSPETERLIDADALQRMKSSAILLNTARGAIVDEDALADALRQGEIAGAGLDTLSQEPPPIEHPLLASDIPNLIVTPHSAWISQEARQRLTDQLADNVQAFLQGHPRNRVNP